MTDDTLHCHVDNLSRARDDGTERSAVATAAYISGADLWNEREQKVSRFGGRRDVFLSELLAPEGAPDWTRDRPALWNKVDMSARRRDSRLAKLIDAAIPREIPKELWAALLRDYVAPFVKLGMAAEAAIHEDGTGHNPHIHVMLTVNALKPDGFGPKLTFADQKAFITLARTGWESLCNRYLAASGAALRLDRRSFKARGIKQKPTKHRGPNPQERRARRAHAQSVREDTAMRRSPHPVDIRTYPLLTAREDWPFADGRTPTDLTPDERVEFGRLTDARRVAAERAAEQSLRDNRVGDWFGRISDERTPASADVPWYLQPEDRAPVAPELAPERAPEWAQPSRDDFEPFGAEVRAERDAYELDLWRRAIDLPRSKHENELMKRAEAHSPDMRRLVSDELLNQRIMRLRQEDDARRLEAFEARLGPALQEPFEDYVRWDLGIAPDPVQGPYDRLEHPADLRRAQDEMRDTYEREERERDQDERDR